MIAVPVAGVVTKAQLAALIAEALAEGYHSEKIAARIIETYGGALLERPR